MDTFKKRVQRSFNRNAESYDKFGIIQREVSTRMIERLSLIKIKPAKVLDLGCGTGFLSTDLIKIFPEANIVSVDFAEEMLRVCGGKSDKITTVCADIEELPFENNKFDLIISSLTFHWCVDLFKTLSKSYSLLKQNGCLVFSSIGPDTLCELHKTLKSIDALDHVNSFIDMHHYGDALLKIGFTDPVVDNEKIIIEYETFSGVMKSIKKIGAGTLENPSNRKFSKTDYKNITGTYPRNSNSNYPVTYEVLYGLSWKKPKLNPKNNMDVIPIKEV